ncbi:hypothetical protein, partial [Klebsiella pneumoniae]|uniref:hypothetical protein n=1 Tax=Klebsiella pneumoniae TaxID=573 RepID=UPI003B982786
STELPYKLIGFAISMAYLIAAIVACKKLFSPPLESVFASTPGTSDPLHNASTGEALDESSEPGVIPPDTPLA